MNENTEKRLEWLINSHYNLFHTKLILAALKSDKITDKDFIVGCVKIHTEEEKGNNILPKEFEPIWNF